MGPRICPVCVNPFNELHPAEVRIMDKTTGQTIEVPSFFRCARGHLFFRTLDNYILLAAPDAPDKVGDKFPIG